MSLTKDKLLQRQQQVEVKIGALSYQVLKMLDEIKALEREFTSLDATCRDLDTEEAIAKAKEDLKPEPEVKKES